MKPSSLIGLILVIVGVVLLVYQGFSFTQKEKVLDVGPVHVSAEKEKTVPIPPIIGWVVTGAGVVLLVTGLRNTRSSG
jgi:hypothetical protein